MWFLIPLVCLLLGQDTHASPVVRQNVGVIYEQLPGQVISGHDTHQMILAIPYTIPDIPAPKPPIYGTIKKLQITTLGPKDSQDARFLQQAADLDTLVQNIDINIAVTMKNIIHFLQDPINNRPKRAVFAFLGELFKSVFGLATTKDINAILNVIQQLDSKIGTLADVNVKTAHGLHDVTQQYQDFIDTYIKEQNAMDQALLNITESVDLWSDDFSTTLTTLQDSQDSQATQAGIISAQTVVLLARLAYHQGLTKIETSLRLLSTGTLAPDLVNPTELARKILDLDTKLKTTSAGSEVTVMDTAYYYSQPVALYTYTRTHLYIHLSIIISSTDSAFNLFQIITTDVPINTEDTNGTGSTRIVSSIDFLAVNEEETLYMEMTNADLHTCHGQILKVCSRTIPRIRSDRPTCHMATFKNDHDSMSRLCTFHIQPLKPIKTQAIALDKDKYLVTSNEPVYHIICQHQTPTSRVASAYAVVGVPCQCHLQFDGLYLPNTKIPCNSSSSTHYIMHTVNMPIITALAASHEDILPNSLHLHPIRLPPLHTAAVIKTLSPLNKLPKDVTMDLIPFTDVILEEATRASDILHKPLDENTQRYGAASFFGHFAWTYITPILTVINTIVIVIVIVKVLGRQAIFTALPMASAKSFNITWKHIPITQQIPPTEAKIDHLDQYIDPENVLTVIILAMAIYFGVKIVKSIKNKISKHFGLTHPSKKTNPTVTLKIYNGHNNHTIQLISVPYEIDVIKLGTTPDLTHITSSSCPYPRLRMTWSGPLTLVVRKDTKTFFLPNHIVLPLKARFSIIPALNDPTTTVALVLKTNDLTVSLPVTETSMTGEDTGDSDHYQSLVQHPSEMTTLELLTAIVKPKIMTGNET